MLLSVVMPIMSIYRLPLGQYGYTGHIINLPQDVVTFAHSLPRLPSEVDVLIVRKDYAVSAGPNELNYYYFITYSITFMYPHDLSKARFELYTSLALTLATLAQMTSASP